MPLCADSPGTCQRHPQITWGLWNGHLIYHQQPWHRRPGFLKGQVTPTEIPNQTQFLLAGRVALLQDSAVCVQLCRNDFGFICKMELSSRLRLKTFSISVSSSEPVMILCTPHPPLPPPSHPQLGPLAMSRDILAYCVIALQVREMALESVGRGQGAAKKPQCTGHSHNRNCTAQDVNS